MTGKKRLAIYDPDSEFAFRFMELAKRLSFVDMDVKAYTQGEVLKSTALETPPELLLVSSSVWSEELRAIPSGKTVLLLEDQATEAKDLPCVYKYQAPEELLRKALAFCEEKEAVTELTTIEEGLEIIGIYSPVGRNRKTSFALALGQILAKNRSVLYLNMETFAGFEHFLSEEYDRTLSDLIYFSRQKRVDLMSKMRGITKRIRNLEYVPPVLAPEDLQDVQAEEWIRLFEKIRLQTPYEVLILDLGEAVRGLATILAACDVIYLPTRNDPLSQAKTEQFLWFLGEKAGKEIQERIHQIKLPLGQSNRTGRDFFAELAEGELGELIREEGMEGRTICRQKG